MKSSFQLLFASRKFWLLVLDAVVSLVLFVVGRFLPDFQDIAKELIAILQPLFVAVIVGIFVEDAAAKINA